MEKKVSILFQLLFFVLDVVVVGKAIDLKDTSIKNIFFQNEVGEISVSGNMVSLVSQPVKYVVYSGTSEEDIQDTLLLPIFVIQTYNEQLNTGFNDVVPKVYVKRVDGSGKIIPLENEDKVFFKLEVDNYYSEINSKEWFGKNNEIIITPLGLLSAKDRNTLKRKLESDSIFDENGIIKSSSQGDYSPATLIKFKSITEGEVEVEKHNKSIGSYAQGEIIATYFTTEKPISTNAKILVEVK
ncbi:hypothetical protein [Cetobacterium somerae]|uniref:hypothetical protein n=1 Tax=Cetobacterium somerae TaxID=188913 RepID=UPI0038924ACC